MTDTVVKNLAAMTERQQLESVAASFGDLMRLRKQQAATQGKLIRWCVMALTQTQEQAKRTLEREHYKAGKSGAPGFSAPAKKVREDRELALLYLQWLATQLENDAPSAAPDELDIRVEAASLDYQ